MTDKPEFWFPRKKYGMGWGLPVTWQGWVVFLSYILLSILGSFVLTDPPHRLPFFIGYMIVLTVVLVVICWKKGEKPN